MRELLGLIHTATVLARLATLLSVSLVAGACTSDAIAARPSRTPRRPSASADLGGAGPFVPNGLILTNGVLQDMVLGPLSEAGLTSLDGIADLVRDDPNVRKFLHYLISCALPEGAAVTVSGETFEGSGGLAPEWADGPCDVACQEWVSACLFARTNVYGLPVAIYITGEHPTLLSPGAEELAASDVDEGAFYGNYFEDPPREYACRGRGYDPLFSTVRVCTQPGNRCGIQDVGACGDVHGDTGEAVDRHACEGFDDELEAYQRCHAQTSLAGSDSFPPTSRVYERVLTVRLRTTGFQGGIGAECASSPIVLPSPAPVPGGAGAPCDNDDDCDAGSELFCDARGPRGMCTHACEPASDPAVEEPMCGGPGTTCLSQSPDVAGICTARCTPGAPGGDCGPGRLCTGYWLLHSLGPDEAGCIPFCADDSDCPTGLRCGRNGACVLVVDETALADGEPCTLALTGGWVEVPCRGICVRVVPDDPTKGLCASIIDLGDGDRCPDDPDRMTPQRRADDDAGFCMLRSCTTDAECTDPLRCIFSAPAGGTFCNYPP